MLCIQTDLFFLDLSQMNFNSVILLLLSGNIAKNIGNMKILSILSIFVFGYTGFTQWQPDLRLTNNPEYSSLSYPNAKCIVSSGDTLHVVWFDYRDAGNTEIYYKRSFDNGINWSNDIRLTNNSSSSVNPTISVFNNLVCIFWEDNRDGNGEIYFKNSSDGGNTWSSDIRLTNAPGISTHPCAVISNNSIYVVWVDQRDGNWEAYFKKSTNNGTAWEPDMRLTNDNTDTGFPSISVSGSLLNVVFEDRRAGNIEIFYKRSTNNGISWESDIRLTNSTYSGIPCLTQAGSYLFVAWQSNRDGNMEIYFKRSTNEGITWGSDYRLTNNSSMSGLVNVTSTPYSIQLVWVDWRDGNDEIYFNKSTDNGLSWNTDTRLTNNPSYSSLPFLTISGSSTHVVWTDNRDGNTEIYYKRNPTGNPVPPVTPQLFAPSNNAINQSTTLNLVWFRSQNALSYRVQLATDAGFSNLIVNDSSLTDTTRQVSGLNNNATYYWRINAKNAVGTSNYSSTWQFTTIVSVPTNPILISPSNNSINQPVNLNFYWSKPQFAAAYRFQLASDSLFTSLIVNDSTLTDTTRTVSGLNNSNIYWWRVNAKNIAGTSNFSAPFKFTTIVALPSAPVLYSPLNNQTALLLSLNLVWLKRPTAVSYRVQLATDSLFGNLIVNDSTLSDSIKAVSGLQPLTNYWWRVNAKNIGGTSQYSPVWKFRTLGSPHQVILINPPDSAVNQPVNIIFRWAVANEQTNPVPFIKNVNIFNDNIQKYWFELNLDTLSAPVVRDSNLVDTFKTAASLTNFTRYYWRVKAKNEIGWGQFSRWFRFNTIILNPSVPLLFFPQDNAINISLNTQLVWYKLPTAITYHVMLARDSSFTQIVINDSTLTDSIRVLTGLTPSTAYYWKVRAKNAGGYSQFSEIWNFTTVPVPPGVPVLVSPPNGSQGLSLTPLLDWDSVLTAVGYQVQVARDTGFLSIAFDSTEIITSNVMVPAGRLNNDSAYFWRVRTYNPGGNSSWSNLWSFRIAPIGITLQSNQIPKVFRLYNNYPNPFNPLSKIRLDIPFSCHTKLSIFDILGREIKIIVNQVLLPGVYIVVFDASDYPSGIYFYRMITESYSETKKMVLVK